MPSRLLEPLAKLVPASASSAAGTVVMTLLTAAFPAEPRVYTALFMLVIIDTCTGVVAASKRGTFNSKTMRRKLLPKMFAYLGIIAALHSFADLLLDTPIYEATMVMVAFTIASIGFVELKSILENVSSILGYRVTLKLNAKEISDLMESHHVREPLLEGEPDQPRRN